MEDFVFHRLHSSRTVYDFDVTVDGAGESTTGVYGKGQLEQEGGRPSRGKREEVELDRLWGDEVVDKMNGYRFDLEVERDRFLGLAGCAHPRTERSGVHGGLVMSMVRGVSHCLWIHHSAQHEQAHR
jgi:hypothetical protein